MLSCSIDSEHDIQGDASCQQNYNGEQDGNVHHASLLENCSLIVDTNTMKPAALDSTRPASTLRSVNITHEAPAADIFAADVHVARIDAYVGAALSIAHSRTFNCHRLQLLHLLRLIIVHSIERLSNQLWLRWMRRHCLTLSHQRASLCLILHI